MMAFTASTAAAATVAAKLKVARVYLRPDRTLETDLTILGDMN